MCATWSGRPTCSSVVDRKLATADRRGDRHRAPCPTSRRPSAACSAASPRPGCASIGFEIAGAAGAAWTDDDGELAFAGSDFLMRQVSCIGGGTTEMARNVISERVLGMPRERSQDRDVAFRDVPRSASSRS